MLVRTTSIRERVHVVQCLFTNKSVRLINGSIIFPPIGSNRVILSHEDALVLTFGFDGFDVRKILIDLGSFVDLLQMSAYGKMGYCPSVLENPDHILISFNGELTISLGDVVLPVQADLSDYYSKSVI